MNVVTKDYFLHFINTHYKCSKTDPLRAIAMSCILQLSVVFYNFRHSVHGIYLYLLYDLFTSPYKKSLLFQGGIGMDRNTKK